MAAEIKKALGVEAEIVKGSKGIFDVYKGEELVFSKYKENRFPEADEIVDALRA